METRDYLNLLERRKWTIFLAICITVAIVAAGSLLVTPTYAAKAVVRVATATDKTVPYYDALYVARLMNTYSMIVTSQPVLQEMKSKFGLAKPPEVEAKLVPDTELISIVVINTDPDLARDIANALADVLIARSKGLYTGDTTSSTDILSKQLAQVQSELDQARLDYEKMLQNGPANTDQANTIYQAITIKQQTFNSLLSQYDQSQLTDALRSNAITIVEPATSPLDPYWPDIKLNMVISLALGGVIGIGLVFFFNSLDTTLYSVAQTKSATGMSIIGQIPFARRKPHGIFFVSNSPQAEAFRRLRINLSTLGSNGPLHVLLVTSATAGEGKTTVASNLAYVMAQSKHKILVIDCELRLPTLHKQFGLPNEMGLSSVLRKEATLSQAIQESQTPGLWLLAGGPVPSNPSELINSPEMAELIKQVTGQFDMVLLDTPALLTVKHGAVLSSLVDGVLLVVARGHVRESSVSTACELLMNSNARSIGIVVNYADRDSVESPV